MRTQTITWALCAAILAAPALAQEESDKVRKARSENELEKTAEDTDKACGTQLAVRIEWAGFDADAAWRGRSVASYCGAPLETLRRLCEGAAVKAFVAKTVKQVVCVAARDKASWAAVIKDGRIEWRVPPDATNAEDFAHQELLRKL